MTTFKIYKLHFTSPLHIGSSQKDYDTSMRTIQSDTLSAALMACLAKYGEEIPEDGDMGFALSSMFPYYQKSADSAPVYFLPRPMQARLQGKPEDAKKTKKVQWVDVSLYGDVLTGKELLDAASDCMKGAYFTSCFLPEDANGTTEFIRSEISERVTVPSRTGEEDAKPYYVDRIVFKDWAGLYFLATGDTTLLEKALSFLALEGFGTYRHVGMGFFEYACDTLDIDMPEDADHLLSLSMFIPESREQLEQMLASDSVAYDFVRRGGWITSYPYNTLRKNAIYAFLPGSVFRRIAADVPACLGKRVNLCPSVGEMTPAHPVWREGRAIMVPIKVK